MHGPVQKEVDDQATEIGLAEPRNRRGRASFCRGPPAMTTTGSRAAAESPRRTASTGGRCQRCTQHRGDRRRARARGAPFMDSPAGNLRWRGGPLRQVRQHSEDIGLHARTPWTPDYNFGSADKPRMFAMDRAAQGRESASSPAQPRLSCTGITRDLPDGMLVAASCAHGSQLGAYTARGAGPDAGCVGSQKLVPDLSTAAMRRIRGLVVTWAISGPGDDWASGRTRAPERSSSNHGGMQAGCGTTTSCSCASQSGSERTRGAISAPRHLAPLEPEATPGSEERGGALGLG